jgi:hypothetical protein
MCGYCNPNWVVSFCFIQNTAMSNICMRIFYPLCLLPESNAWNQTTCFCSGFSSRKFLIQKFTRDCFVTSLTLVFIFVIFVFIFVNTKSRNQNFNCASVVTSRVKLKKKKKAFWSFFGQFVIIYIIPILY